MIGTVLNNKRIFNSIYHCYKIKHHFSELNNEVNAQTFSKIEFRIAEIQSCVKHPQSQKLYISQVLFNGQTRQICSGLQNYIPLQNMKGKVVIAANLKSKKMGGQSSNGMIICATEQIEGIPARIEMLKPQGQLNQRLFLEGFEDLFNINENLQQIERLPQINPKKKILQKCLPLFKTNSKGEVTWNNSLVRTRSGVLKTSILDGMVS